MDKSALVARIRNSDKTAELASINCRLETHPVSYDANEQVQKVALYIWDTDSLAWVKYTGGGNGAGGEVTVTNFPSTQAVSGPLTDTQLRAAAVPISGTVGVSGTVPVSGTFYQATQPVSASSLPLPTGAATETTLGAVNTKLPALESGRVPVVLPAGGGSLTDSELRASPVEVKLKTDDPTYYIYVPPMALAANKIFLALRNTDATPVKVRKLFLVNAALTAVTGVGVQWDIDDISAITAGTAVTPKPTNSADGALPNFTCVHSPTSVTKDFTWFSWYTNNDEIGLTGGFPQATIQALGNVLVEGAKLKDITLNNGEGVCLKQITSTTVGSYGVIAVVTRGA